MLLRRLWIPAAVVWAACTVLIVSVQGLPRDRDRLHGLFTDPACAAPPCFLGITLYETPFSAGRAQLTAHPHVRDVAARPQMDFIGDEHLRFTWSADAAAWHTGEIVASYGTIYSVWLAAGLPLGDVWRALGEPPIYSYTALRDRADGVRVYATLFDDGRARLTLRVACPLTRANFLAATVEMIELRRVQLGFRPPSGLSTLGAWYRSLDPLPQC